LRPSRSDAVAFSLQSRHPNHSFFRAHKSPIAFRCLFPLLSLTVYVSPLETEDRFSSRVFYYIGPLLIGSVDSVLRPFQAMVVIFIGTLLFPSFVCLSVRQRCTNPSPETVSRKRFPSSSQGVLFLTFGVKFSWCFQNHVGASAGSFLTFLQRRLRVPPLSSTPFWVAFPR